MTSFGLRRNIAGRGSSKRSIEQLSSIDNHFGGPEESSTEFLNPGSSSSSSSNQVDVFDSSEERPSQTTKNKWMFSPFQSRKKTAKLAHSQELPRRKSTSDLDSMEEKPDYSSRDQTTTTTTTRTEDSAIITRDNEPTNASMQLESNYRSFPVAPRRIQSLRGNDPLHNESPLVEQNPARLSPRSLKRRSDDPSKLSPKRRSPLRRRNGTPPSPKRSPRPRRHSDIALHVITVVEKPLAMQDNADNADIQTPTKDDDLNDKSWGFIDLLGDEPTTDQEDPMISYLQASFVYDEEKRPTLVPPPTAMPSPMVRTEKTRRRSTTPSRAKNVHTGGGKGFSRALLENMRNEIAPLKKKRSNSVSQGASSSTPNFPTYKHELLLSPAGREAKRRSSRGSRSPDALQRSTPRRNLAASENTTPRTRTRSCGSIRSNNPPLTAPTSTTYSYLAVLEQRRQALSPKAPKNVVYDDLLDVFGLKNDDVLTKSGRWASSKGDGLDDELALGMKNSRSDGDLASLEADPEDEFPSIPDAQTVYGGGLYDEIDLVTRRSKKKKKSKRRGNDAPKTPIGKLSVPKSPRPKKSKEERAQQARSGAHSICSKTSSISTESRRTRSLTDDSVLRGKGSRDVSEFFRSVIDLSINESPAKLAPCPHDRTTKSVKDRKKKKSRGASSGSKAGALEPADGSRPSSRRRRKGGKKSDKGSSASLKSSSAPSLTDENQFHGTTESLPNAAWASAF